MQIPRSSFAIVVALLLASVFTTAQISVPRLRRDSGFTFRNLHYPGSVYTRVLGTNSSGSFVGLYGDPQGNVHGFVHTASGFATIDYPGALGTAAHGINQSGEIVGGFSGQDRQGHGFLYQNGIFTAIDVPGYSGTVAAG